VAADGEEVGVTLIDKVHDLWRRHGSDDRPPVGDATDPNAALRASAGATSSGGTDSGRTDSGDDGGEINRADTDKGDTGNGAKPSGGPDSDDSDNGGTDLKDRDVGDSSGVGLAIAVVALVVVVVGVCLTVIAASGLTTPMENILKIAGGGLSTAIGLLVANKLLLKRLPKWAFVAAGLATAGILYVALVLMDEPGLRFTGELTEDTRAASHVFSTRPGQRVVVVLETSGGLEADLRVSRGRITASGSIGPDGLVRIDDTVPGGTWTAKVNAVGDSVGSYELRIDRDDASAVSVGDELTGEVLLEPEDSNGYQLELEEEQQVFLRVDDLAPADLDLDIKVYKSNGFPAALVDRVDDGWEVFQRFRAGRYVIVVEAPGAPSGRYTLHVRRDAPGDEPAPAGPPAEGLVAVPDVARVSQADAEEALLEAGFAPRSVPACSSSVPEGAVRQVVMLEGDGEIEVVGLDGVVPTASHLEAGTNLIVKIGTGLPCDR
jgi:hypothetical protein